DAAVAEHDGHRAFRLGRVALMKDYAETGDCRRRYILNYFGEAYADACDHCDNCETGEVAKADKEVKVRGDQPFPLKSRVAHAKWGQGVVMAYPGGGKVSVLFDTEGPKELVTQFVVEKRLLAPA
ncbi:MAG: RecQ family ATP-dependent helicase, partial [Phycisphaerales bacterium]|nr:RecQ family ATP-dependent helicase [Phycisphaerales bacterium]